jgi:hypothetical protein
MKAPFDPTHSLKFDLGRGRVSVDNSTLRLVLPADALEKLCKAAGEEAVSDFGRSLGTEIGRRMANRLPAIQLASIEDVVEHLGGEMALMGLGSLSVERWGKALVFVVSDGPFGSAGDVLVRAILQGAMQRALSREVTPLFLGREGERARFLATTAQVSSQLQSRLASGVKWGEALAELQGGAS